MNFEQPTIKILRRLFEGKNETNIHISRLNLVDYEVIEMVTKYKLSATNTRNEYFRDVVTLKFKKKIKWGVGEVNGKQVLIDAFNQVNQDDEVIVTIHRPMNDGTTNQSVVWSDMDFIRVLGILESAKQIAQEQEWTEWLNAY